MSQNELKPFALLAEFNTTREVYHACEGVRDAGYSVWDAHTPFPVHGLDKAMGLSRSKVPWISLVAGLTGASLAFTLQWWISVVAYPLVISGKPYFSWQAFVPVTFEVGVLFAAFGAVLGMFHFNRIPQHYHPLFRSDRFAAATDDKFFISIEVKDPKFNEESTKALLTSLGAAHVEMVED